MGNAMDFLYSGGTDYEMRSLPPSTRNSSLTIAWTIAWPL
jgi:hypothetical protein